MTAPLSPAAPLAPHGACVGQVRAGTALTPEGCTAASSLACPRPAPAPAPGRPQET